VAVGSTRLQYFVTVVEEGQITRAARRLNVAQPALTHAIAQLETDVGVRLFERHARGVTLTRAGAVLYEKARQSVAATADVVQTARSLARSRDAIIEFGFLGTPPAIDSPVALEAFAAGHPGIDIRYRELPFPSDPTTVWLAEVDVAVCHLPPGHRDVWAEPLRRERRVLLVPRDHRLASSSELTVADVIDETFIGFDPSIDREWAGFWSLDDHRQAPPAHQTADRATNPQEVLAALAVRPAVTSVPATVAAMIANVQSSVVAIPLRDAEPATIALVGHENSHNDAVAALRAFALAPVAG